MTVGQTMYMVLNDEITEIDEEAQSISSFKGGHGGRWMMGYVALNNDAFYVAADGKVFKFDTETKQHSELFDFDN
jgi:hypothetical protein